MAHVHGEITPATDVRAFDPKWLRFPSRKFEPSTGNIVQADFAEIRIEPVDVDLLQVRERAVAALVGLLGVPARLLIKDKS